MYSVHANLPQKIQFLGYWNKEDRIQLKEARKIIRRSDLEVRPFSIKLLYAKFYIQETCMQKKIANLS